MRISGNNPQCYIEEEYLSNDNIEDTYFINSKPLFLVNRPKMTMFLGDNQTPVPDNSQKANLLLSTHLQHFTKSGMNSDELILVLDNHPEYINKQYAKKINKIIEINNITKPNNRDFELVPTIKCCEGYCHWVTTVVNFNEDNSKEYFIFDSQQKSNENKPYITTQDGLDREPKILNTKNIQGNSNLCWLYTLEFIKEANNYTKFKELQKHCSEEKEYKIQKHCSEEKEYKIQKQVYKNVENILKQYNIELDNIIDKRTTSKIVGGRGGNKEEDTKQVRTLQEQQTNNTDIKEDNKQQESTQQEVYKNNPDFFDSLKCENNKNGILPTQMPKQEDIEQIRKI